MQPGDFPAPALSAGRLFFFCFFYLPGADAEGGSAFTRSLIPRLACPGARLQSLGYGRGRGRAARHQPRSRVGAGSAGQYELGERGSVSFEPLFCDTPCGERGHQRPSCIDLEKEEVHFAVVPKTFATFVWQHSCTVSGMRCWGGGGVVCHVAVMSPHRKKSGRCTLERLKGLMGPITEIDVLHILSGFLPWLLRLPQRVYFKASFSI